MAKKEQELQDELRDVKEMLKLERRLRLRAETRLGFADERVKKLTATVVELSVEKVMNVIERRERENHSMENSICGGA